MAKYKLKSPIMAADIPEAIELIINDKRVELFELIVERCVVDEKGAPVDPAKITLKEKLELINLAAQEISELGNP